MRLTVIPIIVDVLRAVAKFLDKRLEELKICGRIETTQTTVLLKSARIIRTVLKT